MDTTKDKVTDIETFTVLSKGKLEHGIFISVDDSAVYELYKNRKYFRKDPDYKIFTDKIRIRRYDYGWTYIKRGRFKYSIENYNKLEILPCVEVSVNELGLIVIVIKYKDDGVEYKQDVLFMRLRSLFVHYGYYKR